MEADSRVLVANPNLRHHKSRPRPSERAGSWDLGHCFSDHVYLARRPDLARPIYGNGRPSTKRFVPGWRSHTFESRLDAHLRHYGRLCATHRTISYKLDKSLAEESYPELEHPEALATGYVAN